jgi:hypothetical protein
VRLTNSVAGVFLLAVLQGCAVGVTHQYDNGYLDIKAFPKSTLGIAVQDRRLYVVSKNKPETFVGLSRGGFGNTFDVNTTSGNPLADDFTKTIQMALRTKGVNASAVRLSPEMSEAEVIKRLVTAGDKSVLIILNEWKSDTYMTTALEYNVQAMVIDSSGRVVARKSIVGKDNLGGSAINPPEHSRNAVPTAFRRKLEELFASPEIAGAI